jgi:hypothetical protein
MNSIHRVGMTIAGIATVATVAGAFVAQGYIESKPAATQTPTSTPTETATADPTPDPTMDLAPQTIYVNPLPTPPVIHVTKPAPVVRPPKKPPVIHIVVPTPGGGDDGGNDN